jgi:prepilin-type N-terminal cleavage/methylation domain-containing protein
MHSRHTLGFTLIEISIVMVIIGLLIGGVLVGKDLIASAEIRSTVKQLDMLETAINTFRGKYNCHPGDCKNADRFGLTYDVTGRLQGNGDGNIDMRFNDGVYDYFESATLLLQLSDAKLLIGITGEADAARLPLSVKASNSMMGHQAAWFTRYVEGDVVPPGNYYVIAGGVWDFTTVLLPSIAYALDAKIDDGLPRSGRAMATGTNDSDYVSLLLSAGGPAGEASEYCFTNDSPALYNTRYNGPSQQDGVLNGPLCALAISAGF